METLHHNSSDFDEISCGLSSTSHNTKYKVLYQSATQLTKYSSLKFEIIIMQKIA